MQTNTPLSKRCVRRLLWFAGNFALVGFAGTLWALSEVLETDTDNDGWSDTEEINAGTNPEDPTDPWDSDEDGIADYLEFENGTDPLDPNDPPQTRTTPVYAGTDAPPFVDLIAQTSEPVDPDAGIEIIDLGNKDFDAPAGFEDGKNEDTENNRTIQYRVMGSDPNGWSALVGSGVEYWRNQNGATIGVELCAGPNSRGIKQRFSMEATKDFCGGYALVWDHYGRVPKSGTIDYSYSVRITVGDPSSETAQPVGTQMTIASSRVQAGLFGKECFFFGIEEADLPAIEENGLWISMNPSSTGTFSAVVGKLRIVKICMAVDKNRDGLVSFGSDDLTSEAEPYRFWINNDCDDADMDEDKVSSIDQTGTDNPDWEGLTPNSVRDLEDFSRIQIRFAGNAEGISWLWSELSQGELRATIVSRGTGSKIGFTEHLDSTGNLGYLDGTYTDLSPQIASTIRISSVVEDESLDRVLEALWGVPPIFPNTLSFPPASGIFKQYNLLFEGRQEGLGKHILVFSRSSDHIQETASVWLELLDVRKMFERVKISYNAEMKTSSWEYNQNLEFLVPWDEQANKQIVFIHGWNMEEQETDSYAETSFKRLWWQNYKGRFSSVYWPTKVGGTTYSDSEHIAWKCGVGMSLYIDALNEANKSVNIMAHSMGNIVVGSALSFESVVNNYALMNAAIPIECYDDNVELRQEVKTKQLTEAGIKFANAVTNLSWSEYVAWESPSVCDDPTPAIASRGYRGRLKNVSGNLINFYLPMDFATEEAWEFNNSTQKPWIDRINQMLSGTYVYYAYNIGSVIAKKLCSRITSGEIIEETHSVLVEDVVDSDEVMAYVDSSKTKVAGTEGRGQGKIQRNIDMSTPEEIGANFNRLHSAQFIWKIQDTWRFWSRLRDVLDGGN